MEPESKKAKTIKANRLLQAKVGTGPAVDEKLVAESQKIIDSNRIDFVPLAQEYLALLRQAVDDARAGKKDSKTALHDMIDPVMQLKANASMFDYALAGNLANIMLNFLETLESIDKDVIEIAEAHQKTQMLIVNNRMKGDGGPFGNELTAELKDACKRYLARQASAGKAVKDHDPFFIDG